MEQLHLLSQQVERRRQLLVLKQSTLEQVGELTEKTTCLKRQWEKENFDVERLEKSSFAAWIYELLGKKEEKLEKEQREALAAGAKYRSAQAELDTLRCKYDAIEEELQQLQGCEERFARAKQALAMELKEENGETGQRIVEMETELGTIQTQNRELREALEQGELARTLALELQKELDSAEDLGAWDLLGGGLLVDMANTSIWIGRRLVERLQAQIRRFKTELADVDIRQDLEIHIDSSLRFADWFFDGFIVDLAVQNRIEDAQDRVGSVLQQIDGCLANLTAMKSQLDIRQEALNRKLEQLLLEAKRPFALQ